jgi:RimJ/RimL family protein N-acetyltransferase
MEAAMEPLDRLLSSTQTSHSIVDAQAARRPVRVTLEGAYTRLVPLDASTHARDLYEPTRGAEREGLFRYLWDGPFASEAEVRATLDRKASTDDPLFFAITDLRNGRALGYASFMRMEPAHRCIEVGGILFAPKLQRTPAATEAMYLMARHVFEDLGYRRYEWKCDSLNRPSIRAALRLGFTFEGVFRQHMIVKGRNRDTAWFAMLDSEWPARRAAFERWLTAENFDAEGRQKIALAALR